MKSACDRELVSLIRVEPVARNDVPRLMSPYTSFGERTTHSLRPSTKTPFLRSSRIDKLLRSGLRRSEMTSSDWSRETKVKKENMNEATHVSHHFFSYAFM